MIKLGINITELFNFPDSKPGLGSNILSELNRLKNEYKEEIFFLLEVSKSEDLQKLDEISDQILISDFVLEATTPMEMAHKIVELNPQSLTLSVENSASYAARLDFIAQTALLAKHKRIKTYVLTPAIPEIILESATAGVDGIVLDLMSDFKNNPDLYRHCAHVVVDNGLNLRIRKNLRIETDRILKEIPHIDTLVIGRNLLIQSLFSSLENLLPIYIRQLKKY